MLNSSKYFRKHAQIRDSFSLSFRVFLVGVYSFSYSFPSILRASRQMPFRITTKNVFQFPWRRRTVDSAKEKLNGKLLKNIEHNLFTRGQMAAYMNSYRWLNRRQMENNVFLFWLCYKRNGKRCSCAIMELWMHLGGLLKVNLCHVTKFSLLLVLNCSLPLQKKVVSRNFHP